ncbi:hypothetical protein K0U00_15270, partial [Paenibacillus sepulcri]|nr:hypothetical protein [Paenibacillus sepulcri]
MLNSQKLRKWLAVTAVFSLLFSLLPVWTAPKAEAAGDDLEVTFGAGTLIGNLSHEADNSFLNFASNQPGFTKSDGINMDPANGDVFVHSGESAQFIINVADNPALKAIAQSGQAQAIVGWGSLHWTETSGGCGFLSLENCFQGTRTWIYVDGTEVLYEEAWDGGVSARSAVVTITPTTEIRIEVSGVRDGVDAPSGPRGLFVKFQDKERPEMTDYTFTGNGEEWPNNKINQQELYVKKGENISLSYNFSEPVRPTTVVAANADAFLKHPLFVNPAGTGLPASGQAQYLTSKTYTQSTFSANQGDPYQYFKFPLHDSIAYQYTGTQYHNSGNNPLEPKILIDPDDDTSGDPPIDQPLEKKFKDAVFADAAGNVADISFPGTANGGSNNYLDGKTVDPFDYSKEGFRVIVDAVPPKYTKVGNGIQPQILTGVNLNNHDAFDFTLQLSEPAVVNRQWDVTKTFLLLNNGMKATYTAGEGTDKWTFSLQIPDGQEVETPLLKAVALTNDKAPINPATNEPSDTNVLRDYAGNMLIQPINYDGVWPADVNADDRANVNSKIDWAGLSIDNTPPAIGYHFENGGADNQTYRKNGKVTIDANDPPLIVPALDPVQPGTTRPSKGIYRPSNLTGSNSPAVGLVYYAWTRSETDPFKDAPVEPIIDPSNPVFDDPFTAVKRYALSGKQPREELYPGNAQLAELDLGVVNNKTNLIPLPPEALTAPNSGEWYLHVWTADMTWDSARELMQEEKKDNYIQDHAQEYSDWLDEAPGSEADKIFYANNQALAKVGSYGDLSVWPLADFRNDDSNWTHNVTAVKVDNRAPDIAFDGTTGNDTSSVQVKVTVNDPHSGIQTSQYQWVKAGAQPQDVDWKDLPGSGGTLTLATSNDIIEDGSYVLYVKASDHAGNGQTLTSETVTVNSVNAVTGSFVPEPEADVYVNSHEV